MTQETYIKLQISNVDQAIEVGKNALSNSQSIRDVIDAQAEEYSEEKRYFLDSMMYYDFSGILSNVTTMPAQFMDFKNRLIEIKIANDKMLMDGGFISMIDSEIAKLFLNNTLCKMRSDDPNISKAIKEGIEVLNKIKSHLESLL